MGFLFGNFQGGKISLVSGIRACSRRDGNTCDSQGQRGACGLKACPFGHVARREVVARTKSGVGSIDDHLGSIIETRSLG